MARRATWWTSCLLAIGFAVVVAPAIVAERWLAPTFEAGKPAPVTVRVPQLTGAEGPTGHVGGGGVVVARGELVEPKLVTVTEDLVGKQVAALDYGLAGAVAGVLALLFLLHTSRAPRAGVVRAQLASLLIVAIAVWGAKLLMLGTAASVFALPACALTLAPMVAIDRTSGTATGKLAAAVMALLVPFDLLVLLVLLVQAEAPGIGIADTQRVSVPRALLAGVLATIAAIVAYALVVHVSAGGLVLDDPPTQRALTALAIAGGVGTLLGLVLAPVFRLLAGRLARPEERAVVMKTITTAPATATTKDGLTLQVSSEDIESAEVAISPRVRKNPASADPKTMQTPEAQLERLKKESAPPAKPTQDGPSDVIELTIPKRESTDGPTLVREVPEAIASSARSSPAIQPPAPEKLPASNKDGPTLPAFGNQLLGLAGSHMMARESEARDREDRVTNPIANKPVAAEPTGELIEERITNRMQAAEPPPEKLPASNKDGPTLPAFGNQLVGLAASQLTARTDKISEREDKPTGRIDRPGDRPAGRSDRPSAPAVTAPPPATLRPPAKPADKPASEPTFADRLAARFQEVLEDDDEPKKKR